MAELELHREVPNGAEIYGAAYREELATRATALMNRGFLVVTCIPIALHPDLPGCARLKKDGTEVITNGERVPLITGKSPSYWKRDGSPGLCRWRNGNVVPRETLLRSLRPIGKGLAAELGSPIGIGILTSDHETVIDLDDKTDAAIEAALQRWHGHYIERSPSGGLHVVVRPESVEGWITPRGDRFKKFATERMGEPVGEVLADGSFCVMAPTIRLIGGEVRRYERISEQKEPMEIERLDEMGVFPTAKEARYVAEGRAVGTTKAKATKPATPQEPTESGLALDCLDGLAVNANGERTDLASRRAAAILAAVAANRLSLPPLLLFLGDLARKAHQGDGTAYGTNASGEPDRSAALTGMAREAYGLENALTELGLPVEGSADALINETITALGAVAGKADPFESKADRILATIAPSSCDTSRTPERILLFWCNLAGINSEILDALTTEEPTSEEENATTHTLGGLPNEDAPEPFRLIGFDGDLLVFSVRESGQTSFIKGSSNIKGQLLTLAPLRYWQENYAILDSKGRLKGIDWDYAIDTLLRQRKSVPVFSDERVRGRGLWTDAEGELVVHCGSHLEINGVRVALTDYVGSYHYERCRSMPGPSAEEISTEDLAKLNAVLNSFNWAERQGPVLARGLIGVLLYNAALSWRPNGWITGEAGCGKSTLQELISGLCGCVGVLKTAASTTAAGIRQSLGFDGTPVCFDEIEGSDRAARERISQVLQLMRQASSDSSASIIKGSTSGKAVVCRIRSPFLLSSISLGLREAADVSRTAVLTLSPFRPEHVAAWHRGGQYLYSEIHNDSDFGGRLLRRYVRLWPVFQANRITLERVAAERFGSSRLGRVFGTLAAAAWILDNATILSDADALTYLVDGCWGDTEEPTAEMEGAEEHLSCLQHLLSSPIPGVRITLDRRESTTTTVAESLATWILGEKSGLDHNVARAEIQSRGMLVRELTQFGDGKGLWLVIANNHPRLTEIYRDTGWANWGTMLRRCTDFGAERINDRLSFGSRAQKSKGVAFPLTSVVGSREELMAMRQSPPAAKADRGVYLPREVAAAYGLAS